MNESPPPLPQWLLLRDPGIRKPALIVKFKFTVWPSDPCHNRDGVKGSAKTIFGFRQVVVEMAIRQFDEPALVSFCVESIALENVFPLAAHKHPTKQKPAIL